MVIEPYRTLKDPPDNRVPVRSRPPGHVPALGLAGIGLADRFCFWRGRSGRRYVFSVYRPLRDLDGLPRYADAVAIAVERKAGGIRAVVELGVMGSLPDLSPVMLALSDRRADELHIHLLAGTAPERRAIVADLAGVSPGR